MLGLCYTNVTDSLIEQLIWQNSVSVKPAGFCGLLISDNIELSLGSPFAFLSEIPCAQAAATMALAHVVPMASASCLTFFFLGGLEAVASVKC